MPYLSILFNTRIVSFHLNSIPSAFPNWQVSPYSPFCALYQLLYVVVNGKFSHSWNTYLLVIDSIEEPILCKNLLLNRYYYCYFLLWFSFSLSVLLIGVSLPYVYVSACYSNNNNWLVVCQFCSTIIACLG